MLAHALRDPSPRKSYVINFNVAASGACDLFVIEAPTPDNRKCNLVRLQRLVIDNVGLQTTAAVVGLTLCWVAGPGGGSPTVAVPIDPRNPPAGSVCRVGNTTQAAAGATIATYSLYVPTALAAMNPIVIEMGGGDQVYQQPSALQNVPNAVGLALRHPGATGATGMVGYAVFCEDLA